MADDVGWETVAVVRIGHAFHPVITPNVETSYHPIRLTVSDISTPRSLSC
jgi:hypothetical protein